jgi:carbamoyltransferase
MNILGINIGSHDTSAAVIINGRLICAAEEERFNKKKHTKDFPYNAIKECLRISKINIKKINIIAVSTEPLREIKNFWLRNAIKYDERIKVLFSEDLDSVKYYCNFEKIIRETLGYKNKIKYFRHHLNHLASSYYPSNFKKSLVVSYDGMGEGETAYFAIGHGKKIKIINKENLFPDSLGLIYAAITHFLGWKYNYDEGIVMGLAPYGKPFDKILNSKRTYIDVFREIIKTDKKLKIKIDTSWISYHIQRNTWVSEKFIKVFGKKRKPNAAIYQNHKNIAAALQLRLEEVVLQQLKFLKKKYKINKLCLSGGVALNCSLNGKIHKTKLFNDIFIQPASGDAGLALGAAINASLQFDKKRHLKIEEKVYLGSRFSDGEVLRSIKKYNSKVKIIKKNIYEFTSDALINGNIVAWFQGAAEYGPRALGNRSILSLPRPFAVKKYINDNVKFRETFRPFAPAVLSEEVKNYFHINQSSPFMLIATQAKKERVKDFSATVHIDNTCRVQTVSMKSNQKFYNLILKIFKKTGVPILLNTSFNVKGQPIVNTPEDALDCFLKYNINYLVIGKYVLEKKNNYKNSFKKKL